MARAYVDPFEAAPQILKSMKPGCLLTSAAGGRANPMTIGWGTIGVEWGKPIFICYVRTGRFTHGLIERSGAFTVSAIAADMDAGSLKRAKRIVGGAGSKSGRDIDKVRELGLTLVEGEKVEVPAVKELPVTLECKVIYKRDQDAALLDEGLRAKYYPADRPSEFCGSNCDIHTAYYGEIVSAYILR